jgi:hypothetical protein
MSINEQVLQKMRQSGSWRWPVADLAAECQIRGDLVTDALHDLAARGLVAVDRQFGTWWVVQDKFRGVMGGEIIIRMLAEGPSTAELIAHHSGLSHRYTSLACDKLCETGTVKHLQDSVYALANWSAGDSVHVSEDKITIRRVPAPQKPSAPQKTPPSPVETVWEPALVYIDSDVLAASLAAAAGVAL